MQRDSACRRLVAAAYSLTPRAISGGAAWTNADRYDILASTPGDTQPKLDEQMAMLRKLLADRFHLAFHREPKELPVYAITVGRAGDQSSSQPLRLPVPSRS